MTALLLGCSQQQAAAPAVDLGHINPALSTDPLPILFDPLHAELSRSVPPGTDLAPGYASLDQRFRPAVADARATIRRAVDQYRPGRGTPGQVPPSPAADRPTDILLLASAAPRVEEVVNQTFDSGSQETPDGWTVDVKGVSQISGDDASVTLHTDATGDTTKSLAPTDFVVIDETLTADVKVDTCPEAAGLIHGTLKLNLSERVQVSSPSGHSQGERHYAVAGDILGHVNDAAELTGFDLLHLTFQRVGTEVAATDAAAFLAVGYSFIGIDPTILPGHPTGHLGADTSARVHATNMDTTEVSKEISALIFTAWNDAQPVVLIAQKAWRGGKCVGLVVTKGPDPKRLGPGQTTKFTVEVHHKPDGGRLDTPVVANPRGGKVDPAGPPVAPPAQFSYTAAGGKPQPYSVALKSTSRRGIGELGLSFSSQAYKLTIIGQSSGGGPPPNTSKITATVAPDPTGTFLVGPGTAELHIYGRATGNSCPSRWNDSGPITVPVELRAVDKGDGNFEVQAAFGGTFKSLTAAPVPIGTFPDGGGNGSGTFSEGTNDCGEEGTSSTFNIQADPVPS